MIFFNSVDQIQLFLLKELFTHGEQITSRNLLTLEICNINLCLTDPKNRKTNIPSRKWNFALAIGEFAWHLSGSNNLNFITYYAKQWKEFSSDGKQILESCYGHKIFSKNERDESQWDRLVALMKNDNFTRRAVLDLYNSANGINYTSKDIACVSTVQFLIRNKKLDAIVNMRSNDLIWGLPYDIFLFTMLQEMLALELNFDLGSYYHNVASMHIYEKHFELGHNMLNSEYFISQSMDEMKDLNSTNIFLTFENKIRTSAIQLNEIIELSIDDYWKKLLLILLDFKALNINKTRNSISIV
jgi:thymidylate synthase